MIRCGMCVCSPDCEILHSAQIRDVNHHIQLSHAVQSTASNIHLVICNDISLSFCVHQFCRENTVNKHHDSSMRIIFIRLIKCSYSNRRPFQQTRHNVAEHHKVSEIWSSRINNNLCLEWKCIVRLKRTRNALKCIAAIFPKTWRKNNKHNCPNRLRLFSFDTTRLLIYPTICKRVMCICVYASVCAFPSIGPSQLERGWGHGLFTILNGWWEFDVRCLPEIR